MEVTIRPLQENDAYTSVKWRNDSEVFRYTGNTYDHEITIESELEWIRKVISNNNDFRCAILVDGVYVGNIYLTNIDGVSAHYHIFIGNRNYWGKGVAKLASQQILHYAFDQLMLNSVLLRVQEENCAAIRLYKGLGFEEVNSNGIWRTMIIRKNAFYEKEIGQNTK